MFLKSTPINIPQQPQSIIPRLSSRQGDHAAPRLVAHRARSPWFDTKALSKDFQPRSRSFASFSPTLTRSLGAARAPLLNPARGFSSRKELQSQTEAKQRVLLGLHHNLSIDLTFEALQNQDPFLQYSFMTQAQSD